jgi:hypothetical protein
MRINQLFIGVVMSSIKPDSQQPFILIKGEKFNLDDLDLERFDIGESRGGRYVKLDGKEFCKLNELAESMVYASRQIKLKTTNLYDLEQNRKTLNKLSQLSNKIKDLDKSKINSPILHKIRSLIPNWWFNRNKIINNFEKKVHLLKEMNEYNLIKQSSKNEKLKYNDKYNEYAKKYQLINGNHNNVNNNSDNHKLISEFECLYTELNAFEEEINKDCKDKEVKDYIMGLITYLKKTLEFKISVLKNEKKGL